MKKLKYLPYTILTSNGIKIEIDTEEYADVLKSIQGAKRVYIRQSTFEVIPLRPAPAILRTERIRKHEGKNLAYRGKWRCDWGTYHGLNENCSCKNHREKKVEGDVSELSEFERNEMTQLFSNDTKNNLLSDSHE